MINKGKRGSFIGSTVITLIIIALLILSGPIAEAIKVTLNADRSVVRAGDLAENQITFTTWVNLSSPDAYVPMQKVYLNLSGNKTRSFSFDLNGNGILGDEFPGEISVIKGGDPLTGNYGRGSGYGVDYGYGYGAGYGVGYDFGIGYGYGYGYGQGTTPLNLSYTITLKTSRLLVGDYTATSSVYIQGSSSSHSFSSAPFSFTILPIHYPELVTSYWGTVKILGSLTPNAVVSIYGADGVEIVNTTSNPNSLYQIQVPWDDLATSGDEGVVSGETLTFKVNGTTATTRVVDTKGSNTNLNLDTAPTSTPCTNCGGGGGGSTSGGGGGGGMSGENASNIEVVEKYDMQILKDALTSYRFTHAKNPIMFVNITGNTSLGMITVSIEILKGTSSLVKFPPQGLVYKNVNIWVGSSGFATPKNIKDAFIKFKIDNEWMKANGVSAGDIVLMKWDGNSWISLKTTVVSKDDTNSIFEGWTNSFSPFAIVAKVSGAQPTVTATGPAGTPGPGPTGTPKPITEGQGISPYIIGLIILVIIGAAAYYFMVVKKKE